MTQIKTIMEVIKENGLNHSGCHERKSIRTRSRMSEGQKLSWLKRKNQPTINHYDT